MTRVMRDPRELGEFIDMLRRIAVGLDLVIYGFVQRVLGRDLSKLPARPELLPDGEGT